MNKKIKKKEEMLKIVKVDKIVILNLKFSFCVFIFIVF